MFIIIVVLAVAGAALAYKVVGESPMYICFTTDLSGDGHLCNLVYPTTITYIEPRGNIGIYYTIVDDTNLCKRGISCGNYTLNR